MFNPFKSKSAGVQISMADAVEQAAAGKLILIDVRDGSELAQSGKAEGALHVPLMSVQMKVDPKSPEVLPELSIDTPVGVYCASGARSGMAARAMLKMGYKSVHNLGGLGNWINAGGKIVRA